MGLRIGLSDYLIMNIFGGKGKRKTGKMERGKAGCVD